MSAPAIAVAPDAELEAALELFVEKRIGCVPVIEEGNLVGLVTEMDILRGYANACRRGQIAPAADPTVGEFMSTDPATIRPDAAGDEAAALMREKSIRHLLVIQDDALVGILSDRDIRRARGSGQLETTLVMELMSRAPQTARRDERLSSAALVLSSEAISALPVLADKRPVGIATLIDVMVPCARALQTLA